MTPKQVLRHFGTKKAIAKALEIKPPSVQEWFTKDHVPHLRQTQLEKKTRGALAPSKATLAWLQERGYRRDGTRKERH